jgi:hypothetical protein
MRRHFSLRGLITNNLLHSANLAGFKTHLDSVWVMSGTGQNILHDSARPLSCALVLLLNDVDIKSGFYVFPVLAVHFLSTPYLRQLDYTYAQGRE